MVADRMGRACLVALALFCCALGPRDAAAQGASAYVPLDHPLLPLFEHLVLRGDVEDPSPLVRPFRQVDALRALARVDTVGHSRLAVQIRVLATAFDTLPADAAWALAARAGVQGYTASRRDLVRPAGPDGIKPYFEATGSARFGALVAVTRPAVEPRLAHDPDWTGRRELDVTGRMADAYLTAQWRWVQLFYGQTERNWGPVGVAGIPLSAAGYGRPEFGIALGTDRLRLTALASGLENLTDSSGQVYRRYFFAHRLDTRPTRRLRLSLWETVVVAGVDRDFVGRFRNPVSLLLLANQYGLGDRENNIMVGLDASWQVGRSRLEAQLALDDLQYKNRGGSTRYPDRYAFTLAASGPLGRALSWRALYTQASSLAFRTFTSAQAFLDGGVGIGRTDDDYDQTSLFASIPVASHWLLTPEATLLRQGEGRIADPAPPSNTTEAGDTPQLFIGTVARTYRLALNASGQQGPVALSASGGFHHTVNAGNVAGRTTNRFEGRLFVTLGVGSRGHLE
jgi:hypothetical protein